MTIALFLSLFIFAIAIIIKLSMAFGVSEIMPVNDLKMDDVDTQQQLQIDTLVSVDRKHDRQFAILFLLCFLLLIWDLVLTIGLLK